MAFVLRPFHCVWLFSIYLVHCHSSSYSASNDNQAHVDASATFKYSPSADELARDLFTNPIDFLFAHRTSILTMLSLQLIPVVCVFFLSSLTIFGRSRSLATLFLSATCAGLMADVFLRFIPRLILSSSTPSSDSTSLSPTEHQHDTRVGLSILLGLFLSFCIEKVFAYRHRTDPSSSTEDNAKRILTSLFSLAHLLRSYTNTSDLLTILPLDFNTSE